MNNQKMQLSIIIPAYNEKEVIGQVIASLKNSLNNIGPEFEYEIIVVNDGSYDNTRNILENTEGIRLVHHPYNKGYGAALKTGARHARFDWLVFFDSDGQHRPEYILDLIKYAPEYDMVVGAREGYKGPWIRQPAKKVLHLLANYLVDFKIPDLNSGFRLVKKEAFDKFVHLYPNNFSLSTTSTLAFIKEGLDVKYVPIHINKRLGNKSMVGPRHAIDTFMLIIRMITLFSPMKFFLPISFVFFLLTSGSFIYDVSNTNLTDATVVLFISTILFFFLGVILDHLAAMRREQGKA